MGNEACVCQKCECDDRAGGKKERESTEQQQRLRSKAQDTLLRASAAGVASPRKARKKPKSPVLRMGLAWLFGLVGICCWLEGPGPCSLLRRRRRRPQHGIV